MRAQDSDGRHHAEGAVEPAAVGDGVEVRADRERALALVAVEARPDVSGLVVLARGSDLVEQLAEERARLVPGLGPGDALGASVVGRAALKLAQVGDHAVRVDLAR